MRLLATLLMMVIAVPLPAEAYLQFSVRLRGQPITVRWDQRPVRWFATDRGAPGVSASAFQATMARAFATWEAVPTASITFQFAGFTSAEPFDDENISVLGFQTDPSLDDNVLAETGFLIDIFTGAIVEADILFNAAFPWSTAAGGDPARFDLESIAVHEIGHFIGLDHSMIGETVPQAGGRRVLGTGAVMFPIALGRGSIQDRVLQPDDIAGVSDLYPDGDFRARTGVARGRVTRNGIGVFGAHVTAFNVGTGELVGAFTLNGQGEFEIAGLTPGPHVVRVEPLDDADIDSFFGDGAPVVTTFGVTYHDRLFVAPPGGVGERFDVEVVPR